MNRITALAATVALAAGSLALTAPTQAAPARAYKVTAKANLEVAVAKEDTVKVRGRVTPKAAGQKVVLQQRVGNKKTWKATGKATIKRNGTYVLKDKPTTPGSREYRVLKPGKGAVKKGYSKALEVQVYGWEKLINRVSGPSVNLEPAYVYIGAEAYPSSLATTTSGTPSSIEYTLGRKCTDLRATYALTDSSATGSSGAATVTADGEVLAVHSLAVGTIVADEVLDVTDVFRLKLDLSTTATPAAVAAVATPEVLCTR
ncbi:hypothetical protein GCM10011376_24250 [Nocardioides flavus (ex Wang et al. 2016)]|uniref:NPCBM/NEW2 domain-containing protein n=1 Tax=Nocardioides flavus (ex Wang et al. 2016) TaxID=2058780 RepID=A0ABQ3HLL6_9ACTN|nr:hypothetical protein [Nocardioides flavus (ex Wang et al. 2016)]GHE17815.1 hypothetical protein GCM10011376_24250 [Nocardioides flavus (ex Wang et al. 2016)]